MNTAKVAIQLISTGGVYGAERALLELAAYLREQHWHSCVVALEGRGASALVGTARSQGLSAEAFVPEGGLRLALVPMVVRLKQLLQRYPRAVVHSHGYKPDILLRWLGVPRRQVCLATCHNWISETRKLKLLETLDKHSLRRFDRVAAVSRDIARQLLTSGVPRDKVVVIDNGISIPRVAEGARQQLRAELGVPATAKLIVQIGRLARSKRIDLLLEATLRLPRDLEVHIALVGEGDQRQKLDELVRQQGLAERVHFAGYRSDIGSILAAADVLALSSDIEGLPIVILEAMASHCAVVATRVGGIPAVLTDGSEAWLVPPGDAAELAEALRESLANPGLAQARAAVAFAKYQRSYSREAMGARYLEIYNQELARRGWA